MEKDKLLDILADERLHGALEEKIKNSEKYQSVQKEHDIACAELDATGLNERQSKAVNRVLCTANNCGAIYGAIAYRQGLDDGVKLAVEIKEDCLKRIKEK